MRVRIGWPDDAALHWDMDPADKVALFAREDCLWWPRIVNDQDETVGAIAYCPHCGEPGGINFDPGTGRAVWSWNGSHDQPTISPSILSTIGKYGCGFHCFVTDGVLIDAGTPAHGPTDGGIR